LNAYVRKFRLVAYPLLGKALHIKGTGRHTVNQ